MNTRIEITTPDDWHLHLRDGDRMQAVVQHSARQFGRAIIMPNLTRPVTNTAMAMAYRDRILEALPPGNTFQPLMTLYLTDTTSPADIDEAAAEEHVVACKLYPAGATTHSDAGVTDLRNIYPALQRMAETELPLLVHGEVTDPRIDVFDRESVFIDRVLIPLREQLPELRFVFEHITSSEAVHFVNDQEQNVAATITPQHLLLTRNDLLASGLRPHHYCVPILKSINDKKLLVEAATSGDARYFLGTDSAPHARHEKESACGCAGIYSAHAALELYCEIFDAVGAMDKFESFAAFNGADFYGLPRNSGTITLEKSSWTVPDEYDFAGERLVPLRAGTELAWRLSDD
ncbi:MAG: dihydroorotase [Gammaproteobacteria bacterium]|nr:dihydroorotase [Gammaproteobacteria bacterium]